MKRTREERTVQLAKYNDLCELLAATYRDTDYHFGELHFPIPMSPEEARDVYGDVYRGGYGDGLDHRGAMTVHQIPMLMHPEKGALMLRDVYCHPSDAPEALAECIEVEHSEVIALEWKVRDQLEMLGSWRAQPVVLGVALVSRLDCPAHQRPRGVAPEIIIGREDLADFAERIDSIFEYYSTPARSAVSDYGARLICDIEGSPEICGSFVDRDLLIQSYIEHGCVLDEDYEDMEWEHF